jgi:hypothetical protein
VLLMYGSETDPMFVGCAEALHAVLPQSTVLRLPGLNHDSAQTYGKPETIAAAAAAVLYRNQRPDRQGRSRESAIALSPPKSWTAATLPDNSLLLIGSGQHQKRHDDVRRKLNKWCSRDGALIKCAPC